MTNLIFFHTKKSPPFAKDENAKVAKKLLSCKILDYSHYTQICTIYGAIPYPVSTFNDHLEGK